MQTLTNTDRLPSEPAYAVLPPAKLAERILFAIRVEERALARKRAVLFGFGAAGSAAVTVWCALSLAHTVSYSGFSQYLSLLFSGDGAVYAYWKELALSLADSLPVLGTAVLLLAAAALVWSVAHAYASVRKLAMTAGRIIT